MKDGMFYLVIFGMAGVVIYLLVKRNSAGAPATAVVTPPCNIGASYGGVGISGTCAGVKALPGIVYGWGKQLYTTEAKVVWGVEAEMAKVVNASGVGKVTSSLINAVNPFSAGSCRNNTGWMGMRRDSATGKLITAKEYFTKYPRETC